MSGPTLPPHARVRKDLTGRRFGRLVVVECMGRNQWICQCDCGRRPVVYRCNLTRGVSQSCGCMRADMLRTHDQTHHPLYGVWRTMVARCHHRNGPGYRNYGGRGIRVCPEWQASPARFFADLGPRPSAKHTLDRIDNDGHYEPGNCRWATPKQQARNKRTNRRLTWAGETLCVAEWADRLGLPRDTLMARLKIGWSVERTLTTLTLRGPRHHQKKPSQSTLNRPCRELVRRLDAGAVGAGEAAACR